MGLRVSVCINNFNYAQFLPRAIESVLAQSYESVELVVVDDGSTDGSREVMERYREFGRFITKPNGGQASAVNVGFEASTGSIVIFLDSDDELGPSAVASVVSQWSDDLTKVQFRLTVVDAGGRAIGAFPHRDVTLPSGDVTPTLLRRGEYATPTTSGSAYARWVLERVLPVPAGEFHNSADGYLNAVVPFYGPIRSIDDELGAYHHHETNIWGGRGLSLEILRNRMQHDFERERHIRLEAEARGLDVPDDLPMRIPEHALYRILSLRLDPEGNPGPSDRTIGLLRAGVGTVLHDEDLGVAKRSSWLAALTMAALAPRGVAQRTAEWLLAARPRPRWLRVTARAVDRLSGSERRRKNRVAVELSPSFGPIRVLYLLSALPLGGAERNVVSILPRLRAAGIDATLCTLHPGREGTLDAEIRRLGIRRIDLGGTRLLDPSAWRALREQLRSGGYDVLHTEDKYSHILGWAASRRTGVPVVMTRHVMREDTPTISDSFKTRLDARALRAADRVIAVSHAVRESLITTLGVAPARIVTIHNGIDTAGFGSGASRSSRRRELGWAPEQPVVTMIAALRVGKGHEVLLAAVPRIRSLSPDVRVMLVGRGEREPELRRMAAPVADSVTFLGERADIAAILGASDVLVLPSWTEALPTVLLEAAAAGLPVVATRVGGTQEIVVDGDTGFLVSPGDPEEFADRVVELLADPARAREMGEKARRHVGRAFSLERQSAETLAVYEALIGVERGVHR